MSPVDLIVIGGGLAGLVAAARGADLGLQVTVLEQGAEEAYPCNSRYSAGVFHAAYLDVELPPAELLSAMHRMMGDEAAADLLAAIAANASRTLGWLRAQGGRFLRGPQRSWVMAPPRNLSTGLDWKGRGPDALLRALGRRLTENGGTVMLGARATGLVRTGNAVSGVRFTKGGEARELRAAATIICDGGFSGNRDLIGRHVSPRPDEVFLRNAGTAMGDGLAMAREAGAALTALDRFYGHLLSRDVFHNSELWPFPQIDAVAAAGILVDARGSRLFDEGLGGIYLTNALAAHAHPLTATVIADARMWDIAGREHQVPPNPLLERHGGTLHRAPTIGALAEAAGLPEAALVATVADYNSAVQSGRAEALVPPRTDIRVKAAPIVVPPFVAIPVAAGITHTMGGIKIDAAGRALDGDGVPVRGLYCAGAAAGGLEGGARAGYVGGLIKCVFGLLAAEAAAHNRSAHAEPARSSA